ncbi:glycosyltransferase family 25 protein [Aureimonas fodinaquatilis]|uniref:glycosyltransferase family 25 protein n=1 Tax=Aureimonas fodinaquatilis TaxID=2565783 RepID=UPI00165DEEFB|nr:glycosyltransferase family 25 protein [Aureimonas fodinaquatilis]
MLINHYIINLDRSPDRLAAIVADCAAAGIEPIRVPAVDGKAVPVAERTLLDEKGFLRDHGKRPQPGEFGCYASHLRVFEAFLASDADYAVVLEDDAAPPVDLKEIEQSLLEKDDWDLVKLVNYRMPKLLVDRKLHGNIALGRAVFGPTGGSAAYMLNRKAAAKLLQTLVPMTLPYDVALERGWAHKIRVRHVAPDAIALNELTNNGLTMEGQSYSAYRLKPWQRLPTLRFRAVDFARRMIFAVSGRSA